jgi:hypothetical protein
LLANGQTITTGTWVRCLKRLNPALRVCSFGHNNRLAGLYIITKQGEWEDICGVDKQEVPAYATFDDGGHVIKSGWRRVIHILYGNGYTSRAQINKVCPGFFDSRAMAADRFVGGIAGDPIENLLQKYANDDLTQEQILELGAAVRAKDTDQQSADREHDKWFLEKWKANGGAVKDRPNY